MQTAHPDALTDAGFAALQQNDAGQARALLQQADAARPNDRRTLLGLAYANRALGEEEAQMRAVDAVLSLEPRDVRALLLKADIFERRGDGRAAVQHYMTAVRHGRALPEIAPDLARELQRASQACDRYSRDYEAHLRESLESAGYRAADSPRVAEALDIMTGKARPFFQQPKLFFFPGLPQIQFYDRAVFPWMDAVEAAAGEIREELLAVMEDRSAFAPYVEGQKNRAQADAHGMLGNPDWSSFYLWKNGVRQEANARRCPKTEAALAGAPLTRVKNRLPSVLFSMLRPGARIPPHTGLINARLICHLPLIVPPGCGFRVGNDTREWRQGRAWAFDDTIEHEAWNDSGETRVILLFDIWRPELSEEERAMVAAILEAAEAFDASAG